MRRKVNTCARQKLRRAGKRAERLSLFALALAAFGSTGIAWAETPPSLDDQFRAQLGLGEAVGCAPLRNGASAMFDQVNFGLALRAICAPSAVGSASSLGGGLSDFQATKTVSQFRLARRRIDARLRRGGRRADWDGVQVAFASPASDLGALMAAEPETDVWRLFGEIEGDWRERDATRYESGYEADAYGLTLGLDRTWGRHVIGGWVSYTDADGAYAAGTALVAPGDNGGLNPNIPAGASNLLADRRALESVCGVTPGAGDFSDEALRLGAFWGTRFGQTGFIDASFSIGERDYKYRRNACAIELPNSGASVMRIADGLFYLDNDSNNVPNDNDRVVDDVFAGAISGDASVLEYSLSARTGFDHALGAWIIGPRATLSYTRTEIDAFTETGRTSRDRYLFGLSDFTTYQDCVDNNPGTPCTAAFSIAAGSATGLELSYDDQTRDSLLLELGAEVRRPIDMSWGVLAPHASVMLRHQFEDDRDLVTVRMAQDLRGAGATRFAFATDAPDADDAVFTAGLTALA